MFPATLASLYGVLILWRATLGHVGCVLRAMGLHNSKQYAMDPPMMLRDRSRFTYWMRKMHLVHLCPASPTNAHTLGSWPWTCRLMWHHLHHHQSPCRWSTGIFDSFGDPWGYYCTPTPTRRTTGLLFGEQGANPLSITFEGPTLHYGTYGPHQASWRALWHILFTIWPLKSLILSFVSWFGGLVTKS